MSKRLCSRHIKLVNVVVCVIIFESAWTQLKQIKTHKWDIDVTVLSWRLPPQNFLKTHFLSFYYFYLWVESAHMLKYSLLELCGKN